MPSLSILENIKKTLRWRALVGWPAALSWSVFEVRSALGFPPARLRIKPRQAKYPLTARLNSSSDMDVFRQIFWFDEYNCMRKIAPARIILDLGANVGYSSAYFLSCFPAATLVAVEPDPDNFELCRNNLAPYGERVQVVLGAVWSQRSRLVLARGGYGDGREWATQVRESEGDGDKASVEAWDVPSLLQRTGGEQIDLLKVDIERSELELFGASSAAWLPKVRNICIELHGADCEEVFLNALMDYEYDLSSAGGLTICGNLRRRIAPAQSATDPPGKG